MSAARKPVLPVVAVCAVLVGWLVWACVPALAAAPETPEVSVQSPISATSAIVRGLLNPHREGVPGTFELGRYEFLYSKTPNKTGCKGEGVAPVSPGVSLGAGKEEVAEALSGLVPDTEYAVCLIVHNEFKEEAASSEVSFKTSLPPETPETLNAEPIGSTSETLHGVLNPNKEAEAGNYEFLYRASASECQGEGEEKLGGGALGKANEAVSGEVSGLSPNIQYTFCLLAINGAGEAALGRPVTFTTPSQKPSISDESVSKLGSASASVSAQIDTGGLPAGYRVQYGTTDAYGAETDLTNISAGTHIVTVTLAGLRSNTEYHFRFTAVNQAEAGADQEGVGATFTTYSTGTGALPDDRVYEMVSPAENLYDADVYEGTTYGHIATSVPFKATANGDAVVYAAFPSTGGNGSSGSNGGNSYRATRLPDGRWTQTNITPPGIAKGEHYRAFSSDLSVGIIDRETELPLQESEALIQPPELPEGHEGYVDIYAITLDDGLYHPLFTARPVNRSIGEFLSFNVKGRVKNDGYVGSSADFSHLLFDANDTLLEGKGQLNEELENEIKKEVKEAAEAARLQEEGEKETSGIKEEAAAALEEIDERSEPTCLLVVVRVWSTCCLMGRWVRGQRLALVTLSRPMVRGSFGRIRKLLSHDQG